MARSRSSSSSTTTAATASKPSGFQTGYAGKVEPATRRQAIIDAALDVFAERGFEAARLDDVAARASVAKGTLYLYFHGKEALFEAVVTGAVTPILERLSVFAAAADMSASTSYPSSTKTKFRWRA